MLSRNLEKTLRRALALANARQHEYATLEHLLMALLDRFPVIILLGGALLGWIAGGLMVTDPVAEPYVPQTDMVRYIASAAGAVFVIAASRVFIARRRRTAKA